ncbi:MAG: hypothetical protein LBR80_04035 [Deltaproteobacteria bacterium]|jgi:hypothetical protein|nr:hypothetical protein [Deltaproteobacteria bacterium]
MDISGKDIADRVLYFGAAAALFVGIKAFIYMRDIRRDASRRGKAAAAAGRIEAAKAAGKSVLYFRGSKLELNGEVIYRYPKIDSDTEWAIAMKPGAYDSVGTSPYRVVEGGQAEFFRDAELSFTLEAGKGYELGIVQAYSSILEASVSSRLMGTSGDLALACLPR